MLGDGGEGVGPTGAAGTDAPERQSFLGGRRLRVAWRERVAAADGVYMVFSAQ